MKIPAYAGGLFTVDRVPLIPSASYETLRTDAQWSVFQYVFKASSDNWPPDHVRLVWFVPQYVVPEAVHPVALGHIVQVLDDDDAVFVIAANDTDFYEGCKIAGILTGGGRA